MIILTDMCSQLSSTECVACKCNEIGSVSTNCDSNGRCTCKDTYYGKMCQNRDCEMTTWSSWTNCRCGYTDNKSRTRNIKNGVVGEGKPCMETEETGTCTMVPCDCDEVNPGHYGDRCEDRDCVLSSWSEWSGCGCHCPSHNCGRTYPRKHRTRSVQTEQAGNGKECGDTSQNDSCGHGCRMYCRRITTRTRSCDYVEF